jgi:hypothetical protein
MERTGIEPSPLLACAPASGTQFPIGTTLVTCTATDISGKTATATFSVQVRGADEQITALMEYVDDGGIGPGTSLHDKLVDALSELNAGQPTDSCLSLRAFVKEVQALPSTRITDEQSRYLIASAESRLLTGARRTRGGTCGEGPLRRAARLVVRLNGVGMLCPPLFRERGLVRGTVVPAALPRTPTPLYGPSGTPQQSQLSA